MKVITKLIVFLSFFIAGQQLLAQCSGSPVLISGNVCQGSVLKATINNANTVSSITWNLNGVATGSPQSVNFTGKPVIVAGGNGSGAGLNQLINPVRLFVDKQGNLYIPDLGNHRVVKWAPGATAGVVVAGGNGIGSAANQFYRPTSVFVDPKGNMYITDQYNNRVQKWAPGANSGVTVAYNVKWPTCVFVDDNENIYVSEQDGSAVTRFSPSNPNAGVTVAGGRGYGSAAHELSTPTGIYVDASGNVYVCDTDNNRVQMWAPGASSGVTVAGSVIGGIGANQLANPLSVYVDSCGNIFVADYNNYRVQKWEAGANTGITIAGGRYSSQLIQPIGVAFDQDMNLYVSDFNGYRVLKYATSTSSTNNALVPGIYTATIVTTNGKSYVSNAIIVEPLKTPKVTISADKTNICPNSTVNFTAAVIDEGSSPFFQWKKNGNPVGANTYTYKDNSVNEGDIINCAFSTNGTCYNTATVVSNSISLSLYNVPPPVNLGNDIIICPGKDVLLKAGSGYESYLWQDGSKDAMFTAHSPGKYYVSVTGVCSFKSFDTISVSNYLKPADFLPATASVCKDGLTELSSLSEFAHYSWNTLAATKMIEVREPGKYSLEVTDSHDCVYRDSILVYKKDCGKRFFVPSSFSPNGDYQNDIFRPVLYDNTKQYRFSVFNRWGQLVFTSSRPDEGWDGAVNGQRNDASIFIWTCTYQFAGEPVRNEKGTVLLLQ